MRPAGRYIDEPPPDSFDRLDGLTGADLTARQRGAGLVSCATLAARSALNLLSASLLGG